MNRRGFLGNLIAVVAAVLGAGMAAPKAEARNEVGGGGVECPDCAPAQSTLGGIVSNRVETGSFAVTPLTYTRYPHPIHTDQNLAAARAESRAALGLPVTRGEGDNEETRLLRQRLRAQYGQHLAFSEPGPAQFPEPLTFEAMQADCAARGCLIEVHERSDTQDTGMANYSHDSADPWPHTIHSINPINTRDQFHIYAVDEWRKYLHWAAS